MNGFGEGLRVGRVEGHGKEHREGAEEGELKFLDFCCMASARSIITYMYVLSLM